MSCEAENPGEATPPNQDPSQAQITNVPALAILQENNDVIHNDYFFFMYIQLFTLFVMAL